MTRHLFTIILLLGTVNCFCQIYHVDTIPGESVKQVTAYRFKSIDNTSKRDSLKIWTKFYNNGYKTQQVDYSFCSINNRKACKNEKPIKPINEKDAVITEYLTGYYLQKIWNEVVLE